jgi:hypothetical protein
MMGGIIILRFKGVTTHFQHKTSDFNRGDFFGIPCKSGVYVAQRDDKFVVQLRSMAHVQRPGAKLRRRIYELSTLEEQ